jgi:iron complex outermembrane recepter protein
MKKSSFCILLLLSLLLLHGWEGRADSGSGADLSQLSIEELMNREVTSVSKMSQRAFDSAAAVFVITQQDIRRSGVTTIAEALRMVPGMVVARIDANKWAVSARGFNSRFANKMLVLVDGRTVYTPAFSGTYWETLDPILADIDRIEVIRGPGASLWGANAVNGIVNIITKGSQDTQGGLVGVTVGDEERGLVDLRYGTELAEHMYLRAYGKYSKRDDQLDVNGDDAQDDWDLKRGGFRADWRTSGSDIFMLQGDIYHTNRDQNFVLPSSSSPTGSERVRDSGTLSGNSLLGRWEQIQSLSSRTAFQFYYEREESDDPLGDYNLDIFDFDFQHEVALPKGNELIWGGEYRFNSDDFNDVPLLTMSPKQRDNSLFGAFVQDKVNLFNNRLEVTFGSKFEYNSFTGWEVQPTVRALWDIASRHRLWMAVSRATRTPSRVELNGKLNVIGLPSDTLGPLPGRIVFQGDDELKSETLVAYELGYRTWPADNLFLDIVTFYNDYDELRTGERIPSDINVVNGVQVVTLPLVNGEKATMYGLELAADWRPTKWSRMQLSYSFLRADFEFKSGNRGGFTPLQPLGDDRDPHHQVSLRSSVDMPHGVEFDAWFRYVDEISDVFIPELPGIASIDDYFTADMRIGWRLHPDLSVSFVGRNLFDSPRVEFLQEASSFRTQIERSFYGRVEWRL